MGTVTPWEFNNSIATIFPTHARNHIPNYDQVINECIKICIANGKNSKIIDVGCAVGETLTRLKDAGFKNIYGVDSSQAMLDVCPKIATLFCSDSFPNETFDIVLMNWTLHFIPNKPAYLKEIYKNLSSNGILVLTEKTSKDPYPIKFYHDFKRSQGVSEQDISDKEKSIENIMYINDVSWYLDSLKNLGFKKVFIINSFWCFTTFVCIK